MTDYIERKSAEIAELVQIMHKVEASLAESDLFVSREDLIRLIGAYEISNAVFAVSESIDAITQDLVEAAGAKAEAEANKPKYM